MKFISLLMWIFALKLSILFQPDFSTSELDSQPHESLLSGSHGLFDGLVRHDRLLTDCQDLISSNPVVKSEHSYSSVVGSDGDSIPDSPLSSNETGKIIDWNIKLQRQNRTQNYLKWSKMYYEIMIGQKSLGVPKWT